MPGVRVFVECEGELRRAFELRVTHTDASLYLHPTAPSGVFDYGKERFEAEARSRTFNPEGQLRSTAEPHLSIKESGQVHIRARGGPLAGPLQIPPLTELRGEHVATLTVSRFDALPIYRGERANLAPPAAQIVYVDAGVESGRLCLYVNGAEPAFSVAPERIAFTGTVGRPDLPRPVFFAVAPWGQEPLGDEPTTVLLAGFNPRPVGAPKSPFLFLRGR